jgi:heat shock protein HslJ
MTEENTTEESTTEENTITEDKTEDPTPTESGDNGGGKNNNTLLIVLIVALVLAIFGIGALAIALISRDDGGDGSESTLPTAAVGTAVPTQGIPLVPTRAPEVDPPDPEPGAPSATVIAPDGAFIRTGPGTLYPSMGLAPQGAVGAVVGISVDTQWYALTDPNAPVDIGWILGSLLALENVEDVPTIPWPPPQATPTPTATPAPDAYFTASRNDITAGETSVLSWSVTDVQAVYVYPIGADWTQYGTSGQGTKTVTPLITTTYQMRVVRRDGVTELYNVEIRVSNGLTTGVWRLTAYADSSGILNSVLPNTTLDSTFSSGGQLSGNGGCNTYTGSFTAYDVTLRISIHNQSQSTCDENVMAQETAFFRAMDSAAKMSIAGNTMTVLSSTGRTVLSYTR